MNSQPRKRFPWIWYWILLGFICAFTLAPVGAVIVCSAIANAYGCKVDEGSVHPCIINGEDYGHFLYTLGISGWFMLFTLPAGLFAFVIWLIVLILHRERWRKRVSTGIPPPVPPPVATSP